MSPLELVVIVVAGVLAGAINAIVGSGTLVTFPTLLMLGYPPLVANMSNNVGLVPGGVAGAYGYRRELVGQGCLVRRLVPPAVLGGATGAILLLVLPASVFGLVVPVLVAFGLLLVVLGPRLSAGTAARAARHEGQAAVQTPWQRRLTPVAAFGTGVYGGYFGAAQGIILMGLLSALVPLGLQRLNAVKNVMVPGVNLVAALLFVALRGAEIDWRAALLIGVGSSIGGYLGSHLGRRMPPTVLRAVILVVGTVALARITVWK